MHALGAPVPAGAISFFSKLSLLGGAATPQAHRVVAALAECLPLPCQKFWA